MTQQSRWSRLVGEARPQPWRSESERDRDQILYSSAFRRLGGVTQVAAAGETTLLHNRLTHSLKVGQVGRKIAATLNALAERDSSVRHSCLKFSGAVTSDYDSDYAVDPWVLESAGMTHDLGHPPFGHIAERILDKAVSSDANVAAGASYGLVEPAIPPQFDLRDGFEGNAQSFRIVTRLSVGKPDGKLEDLGPVGLNLTRAVLSGISKYPWLHDHRPPGVEEHKKKWGAYDSEEDILVWCMRGINGSDNREGRTRRDGQTEYRSVEAQAMDWADDITYAVHDLEDFSRAGLIPLNQLRTSYGEDDPLLHDFWRYCEGRLVENLAIRAGFEALGEEPQDAIRDRFFEVLGLLPSTASGRRLDREGFRGWATDIIDELTGPSSLSIDSDSGSIEIRVEAVLMVEILKKLTWYFVIERPGLASAQRGQARLVRELYAWLIAWASDSYSGPEPGSSLSSPRRSYSVGGIPPRLTDYLDKRSGRGSGRTISIRVKYPVPLWTSSRALLRSRPSRSTAGSQVEMSHRCWTIGSTSDLAELQFANRHELFPAPLSQVGPVGWVTTSQDATVSSALS